MNSIAQLITDLVEAYADERDARRGYDGGSWGYHGHRLISARAEAVLAMHLGAAPPAWYSRQFSVTEHIWT